MVSCPRPRAARTPGVLASRGVNAAPPRRRGPRRRRLAVRLLAPVIVVALALTGVALGLRVASPGEYDTQLGRVSVRVEPAAHGQVEAYIPLADWGVRSTRSGRRCACTSSRGPSSATSCCAPQAASARPCAPPRPGSGRLCAGPSFAPALRDRQHGGGRSCSASHWPRSASAAAAS